MLLKGNAESTPIPKVASMLEMHPREKLEDLPSPRVLNSHLPLYVLPRQLKGMNVNLLLNRDKGKLFTTFVPTKSDSDVLFSYNC